MYNVKTVKSAEEVNGCEIALVDKYNWGGDYRPYTQAQLCYVENKGFCARLLTKETNPRAVNTEINSPVHEDSCLEFFVDFCPEKRLGYLNFEVNARGVHHCEWGGDKRRNLSELGCEMPKIAAFKTDEGWGVTIEAPLELIEYFYGELEFNSGYEFKASFYKCGDKTEHPHYASYNVIELPNPRFHCPDMFENFVIC